jgi:hypothetical protein
MLTFDKATHTYRWNGEIVPSVTTIMGKLRDFARIPDDVLAHASDRGTDTHDACHLDDDGVLDESTVSAEVQPYLDAWRLFRQREKPLWTVSEEPLYSTVARYASTTDRFGFVFEGEATVEIKTTVALHPCFGVQLAGYERLLKDAGKATPETKLRRYAVQLKRDGKYVVKEYADQFDHVAFASCLSIYNWRAKHGC